MDFGHQRAGSVKNRQIAAFRLVAYGLRDAVGGENQDRAVRHFANLLDKNSAALTQAIDNIAVVHDFMTHVDRRAI